MGRTIVAVIITFISLIISASNICEFGFFKKISLGLDLRGGNEMLLQLDSDDYLNDNYQRLIDQALEKKELRTYFIRAKIDQKSIQIKLKSDKNYSELSDQIIKLSDNLRVDFDQENKILYISYTDKHIKNLMDNLVDQTIEIVRTRLDSSGLNEISIQKKDNDKLLVQIPGTKDPKELRDVISRVAKLTFHLVSDEKLNSEQKIVESIDNSEDKIAIYKRALFNGNNLKIAKVEYNELGMPVVSFSLDASGSKIFFKITSENVGKRIAILLDGKFITAPVINQPITGGSGIISSNNLSFTEASKLVSFITSGSLPSKLVVVEESIIGPSLGSDYIKKGKISIKISLVAIMTMMIIIYSIFGVLASISLILTIIYMISLITIFNMTLSFGSIAGMVLTIGMAVDANVLIYERIKDEIRSNNSIEYAIHLGFKTAFTSIYDSNITTLIAMLFLYLLGKGILQSFAISLSIGIIASMFSALVTNRVLIKLLIKYKYIFKKMRLL